MKKKMDNQERRKYEASIGHNVGWQGSESLNEPYLYTGEGELISDISTSTPTYFIKETYGVVTEEQNNIVIRLEHESVFDENIRPEYVQLIADMRKSKYRNEIVCKEIEEKHNKFMKSLKKVKHL